MSESVQVALIVGAFGFLGSLGLAWLTGRQRRSEADQAAALRLADKQEDWARQDAVAEQVRLVAERTAVTDQATSDALRVLHNGQVQIHELVNSNLTASMQDGHDSAVLWLAALEGQEKSGERDAAIELAKAKVAELGAQLADRAKVQRTVDAQVAAAGPVPAADP